MTQCIFPGPGFQAWLALKVAEEAPSSWKMAIPFRLSRHQKTALRGGFSFCAEH